MRGNGGNDSYYVDDAQDRVIEESSGGWDTVYSSVDWRLEGELERLVLLTPAVRGWGNGLNNELVGNAQGNRLDGGGGLDTMAGQSGDDVYVVDTVGDVVIEGSGGGLDTVLLRAQGKYVLGAHVERVLVQGRQMVDVEGNGEGNVLLGNAGSNRLWGMGGDDLLSGGLRGTDFLYGGSGNDVYYVRHGQTMVVEVTEAGLDAGGRDTVVAGVENYRLGVHVEDLVLRAGIRTGWGNELGNRLEGNFLDNRLLGWGGDDVLAGGVGSDELVGGEGADWFLLDALGRGVDKLMDFSELEGDKLGVKLTEGMRASLRGGLVQAGADGLGEMVAGVVVSGVGVRVAQEWDDRWLYDSGSGELRWDADGVGGMGSELVAVLGVVGQRPQQLSSEDFILFG